MNEKPHLQNDINTNIDKATTAASSDAGRAPEGWKLVPIDATQAMLDEGYWPCTQGRGAKSVWHCMLKAAPVAPAAVAQPDERVSAALQACVDVMLHDGVPTDPEHPARIALTAAECVLSGAQPDEQAVAKPIVAPAAVDDLKRAGAPMANTMFNLAQRPGATIDTHLCVLMDQMRREWDATVSTLYAAPVAPAAVAPEGWKLVPVELTERMGDEADFAMQKHAGDDYTESDSFDGWFKPVWSAMLAAAPTPTVAADAGARTPEFRNFEISQTDTSAAQLEVAGWIVWNDDGSSQFVTQGGFIESLIKHGAKFDVEALFRVASKATVRGDEPVALNPGLPAPKTYGGFRGAFYAAHHRAPTKQQIFDAGVRSALRRNAESAAGSQARAGTTQAMLKDEPIPRATAIAVWLQEWAAQQELEDGEYKLLASAADTIVMQAERISALLDARPAAARETLTDGQRADIQQVIDSLDPDDACGDESMISVLNRVLGVGSTDN